MFMDEYYFEKLYEKMLDEISEHLIQSEFEFMNTKCLITTVGSDWKRHDIIRKYCRKFAQLKKEKGD